MGNNAEFKKQLIRRAFKLAREIILLVDKFPNKRSGWVIADQLIRAGTRSDFNTYGYGLSYRANARYLEA